MTWAGPVREDHKFILKVRTDTLAAVPYFDPILVGYEKKREHWVFHAADLDGVQLSQNRHNHWWIIRFAREMGRVWAFPCVHVVKHRNGLNIENSWNNKEDAIAWAQGYLLQRGHKIAHKNPDTISVPIEPHKAIARFLNEFNNTSGVKKLVMAREIDEIVTFIEILKEAKEKYVRQNNDQAY